MTATYKRVGISALLVLTVATLFAFGAPTNDAFSWPDAPRHALNGAFVLDLIRQHPFRDPAGYAYNYYSKYPALTILFYPPLFYFVLAFAYALFGVSQASALGAEFVCYVALVLGACRLARFWLSDVSAFAAAFMLAAAPETAYWGRQVMLEIPAFALLVWSAVCFMKFVREDKTAWLYMSAALLVLAMYTKISSGFVGLAYAAVLLDTRGRAVLRERNIWFAAALSVLALLPLAILTLKFGQQNIRSVAGIQDAQVSRSSLEGWIWYARQMPSQVGPLALAAAAFGIGSVLVRRELRTFALPLSWLIAGYLFFSAIDLKESRHAVFLLLPLSIFAVVGATALFRAKPQIGIAIAIAIGLATLALTLATRPVQYVSGYDRVADYVVSIAPKDGTVAFSGYRDGAFIFAMRTHEERRDISIVRSDKLLLNVAIRRSLGVEDKQLGEAQITQLLDNLGIRYVIAQPGFWTDLPSMKRLENVLNSKHFEPMRQFPMQANYNAQEKELTVYRNLDRIAVGPIHLKTNIPTIGQTISGVIGEN